MSDQIDAPQNAQAPAKTGPVKADPTKPQALQEPGSQASQAPKDQAEGTGAGSKDAVLADLAGERQKRQELERTVASMRDGIAKAFGLQPESTTPEQIATEGVAEVRSAVLGLAVFRATPAGVDADALLDSTSFRKAIEGMNPNDGRALKAAIEKFVDDNPRFRTTNPGAGARDATARGNAGAPASMDDWIRGRR